MRNRSPSSAPQPLAATLLAAAALMYLPDSAQANPRQSVNVLFPGQGNGTLTHTDPEYATALAEYGGLDQAVNNFAIASRGAIGVRSTASGHVATGRATATTEGTYRIVGPGSQVTGSLNLTLDGGLGVEGGEISPSAGASIEVHYAFGPSGTGTFSATLSKPAGLGAARLSFTSTAGVTNPFESGEVGAGGLTIHGSFTSQTITLPVGTPISFQLQATARSFLGAAGAPDEFGGASAQFEHTFSLATDQAVFNLPPGYTVESADLGIVANHYTLPAVPEPGSTLLMALGLCVLRMRRRRAADARG